MRPTRRLLAPRPHTLRDYALIADGERGAILGPEGDIAWLCFPWWDSPAIFASLIGGSGHYTVQPAERFVWGGYYEEASLIWHSRWVTTSGVIECREALVFPGDAHTAVLLRRVIAVDGPADVSVVLHPRADYGDQPFSHFRQDDDGRWLATAGSTALRWSGLSDAKVEPDGHRGHALLGGVVLSEGEHLDLVLELSDRALGDPVDADRGWQATEHEWAVAVPALFDTVARRDGRHAYAVLRGLTAGTGAMVAAATTSMPERAEEGRNYDYRYAWIRDQCLAGQAVGATVGRDPLLSGAVGFVAARLLEDGPDLAPAYTTLAGRLPDQRSLDLPGYPGGSDRIGNWVNQQFQLDALGEALLLFAGADACEPLDADTWRAAQLAVSVVEQTWTKPDAGIWELPPRRWTHSALECVAGLKAISTSSRVSAATAANWEQLADTILAEVGRFGVHASGRWRRAADDDRIDAALLVPTIRGGIPERDPRAVATLHAVQGELSDDGYVYRFAQDDRELGNAEGAFLLCGFWMSLAWLQQGNREAAMHWFDRNRSACGPPGLCSEEFDVGERQLRGNLPQAFVHALLLECSGRLHEG